MTGFLRALPAFAASIALIALATSCALFGGGEKTPAAPDSSGMLRIVWSVQSQRDVAGFNVLRADSENGPWVVANDEPVVGADTTLFEERYTFFDTGLETGRRYFYVVERIGGDGETKPVTAVVSGTAKERGHYIDRGYDPPAN